MPPSDVEILLQITGCKISRADTKYRAAILPSIRLTVKLIYLANGESFTKHLLRRTAASLGIHQFLVFPSKMRFQRLYFLLYFHRTNTKFCNQSITRINFSLPLPYLTYPSCHPQGVHHKGIQDRHISLYG
jgi:hypothetical protein